MGIFRVPVPPKYCQLMFSAEDRIWASKQDGCPLEKYVEEFAELSCKFEIEEVQKTSYFPRPAPSETQAAWPVHQLPISSTYPSSGYSSVVLPDPKPNPPKKKSNTRSRRPKGRTAASPEPPVKPASKPEPLLLAASTPVPSGLLIEYEGISWTPSPDPSPITPEPAPATDEPAPTIEFPKNFFF